VAAPPARLQLPAPIELTSDGVILGDAQAECQAAIDAAAAAAAAAAVDPLTLRPSFRSADVHVRCTRLSYPMDAVPAEWRNVVDATFYADGPWSQGHLDRDLQAGRITRRAEDHALIFVRQDRTEGCRWMGSHDQITHVRSSGSERIGARD
jgi:hypothetical protein